MPLPRGASAQHCRLTLWTLVAALCALYCLLGVVWAVAASPTAHGDGEIAGSDGDLPHAGQDGDNSTTSDSMPLCSSLPSPPAIGIDLGTTYSCVAAAIDNRVEVIPNELGHRVTPSWVAFTSHGRLVGDSAKNQVASNVANTVYDIKRLMGRSYEDARVELPHLPYAVFERHGRPVIGVQHRGQPQEFAPEEISAAILGKMKTTAEAYLGCRVTSAVVTVPAYFNDAQRHATQAAGIIAGLDIRRVLNEPTAAALAAGMSGLLSHDQSRMGGKKRASGKPTKRRRSAGGRKRTRPRKRTKDSKKRQQRHQRRRRQQELYRDEGEDRTLVLAFDLGGGTFDVSLLAVADGVFEVLATAGDTRLGGEDFDRALAAWAIEQFEEQHGVFLTPDSPFFDDSAEVDSASAMASLWRMLGWASTDAVPHPARYDRAMQRIRKEANRVKHVLSSRLQAELEVPTVVAGHDMTVKVSRAKFEELITPYIARTYKMVKRVLNDAGVTKDDVHKVVLVGGSTRIPGVRRSLARRFGAKKVSSGVNPDEAVAIGAAIQAGVLAGQSPSLSNGPRPGAGVEGFSSGLDGSGLVLLDVTPLSLGIASASGLLSVVVPRNTVIPAKASRVYTTDADNQGNIFVEVYQGERAMAKDNALLGSFLLDDIPPAPRHVPQIEVTFRLDVDGMLSVVAEDQATGHKNSIVVRGHSRFTDDDIRRMRRTAERFADQDNAERRRIEAFNAFESLVMAIRRQLDADQDDNIAATGRVTPSEVRRVTDELEIAESWVSADGARSTASFDETTTRHLLLAAVWDPVVTRLYSQRPHGAGTSDHGAHSGPSRGDSAWDWDDEEDDGDDVPRRRSDASGPPEDVWQRFSREYAGEAAYSDSDDRAWSSEDGDELIADDGDI